MALRLPCLLPLMTVAPAPLVCIPSALPMVVVEKEESTYTESCPHRVDSEDDPNDHYFPSGM